MRVENGWKRSERTFIAIFRIARCFMDVAKSIRWCEGWNLLDDNLAYVLAFVELLKISV